MGVNINSTIWNSIFAVPTCVVDEHIQTAGGQQLKVFLYILRHNNENLEIDGIARGIGMSIADVKDAMQYWVAVGLVSLDDTAPQMKPITINAASGTSVDVKRELVELPDIIPTYEQVATRLLECSELKALYNEAQLKLGKTIGYDIQAKLLMIYDHYGLPAEVILTIVEFAVSQGKGNISYIQKVAKEWADNGVNTLEAADEKLKQIQAEDNLWKKFAGMFSAERPQQTASRLTYLKKWHLEHKQSLELIYYACEETINRTNKMNFKYMDTMLESWYLENLKTPVDVIQSAKSVNKNIPTMGRNTVKSTETSYDSNKYIQKAQSPIEYKRRNTNG